jgi:ABC-type antimicrobial peptide transport system permease subunit
MSVFRFTVRSVIYHRRLHAGLLLGTMLACGLLTGALLVGDSVDYSLHHIATARLGRITFAMNWGTRLFGQDLAARLETADGRLHAAAVLSLRGMASRPPGTDPPGNRLNQIQVIGVDPAFWQFCEEAAFTAPLDPQEAAINEQTAAALDVQPGEDISLRMTRYGGLPQDAPLSSRDETLTASSLVTVKAVLSDAQLGRFSLAANQNTPYNVFVDRAWLQEQTGQPAQANIILANGEILLGDLQAALDQSWTLEDIGLRLRSFFPDGVQLESTRIFLDDEVVRASGTAPGSTATLTYLVNAIAKGERMTPYSFVEAGPVPPDMRDDEVIINQWLADQLGAGPGDTVEVTYFQLMPTNAFAEHKRGFKVHRVASMDALGVERELAPRFPGLSEVESCRDWDIGLPMDEARLSDPANEAYWKQYGQTPKLLTTLKAGQEMWANRFGAATAVRFKGSRGNEVEIQQALHERISPSNMGLQFLPVRQAALDAVNQATDFGGLFVGMSFFLIAAALILLGLLYAFGLQQRAVEVGTLLAIGFTPGRIRFLLFMEAIPAALAGSLLGALAGAAYARLLMAALARFWPAAVASTTLRFHVEPASIAYGLLITLGCILLVVLSGVWRSTRYAPHELLTTDFSVVSAAPSRRRQWWSLLLPTLAIVLAVASAGYAWRTTPGSLVEPFFLSGALLLLAGTGYYWGLLTHLARRPAFRRPRLWKITLANLARRRGRSLSVAGFTACGCFLIFSVSSMQENVSLHAGQRSSGTGGFGVFAETSLPVVATPEKLPEILGGAAVPLRVRDGDDASCLNLNRAQTPRVLGVNAETLAGLGAFAPGPRENSPWRLLDRELPEGMIPALVGDTNTAAWGLGKKVGLEDGDVLTYRGDSGVEFKLKLVGQLPMPISVFQGSILISDAAFTRMFPSEAGFRQFLIDTPPDQALETAERLNRDLERHGMAAVPSVQRLSGFYAVEGAYLSMFLVLGGLGLVLGAGGTGIVVLRNLFERRREIALLDAIGYKNTLICTMLIAEHGLLVFAGILIGATSAGAAILPLVLLSQTTVSAGLQAGMLALIAVTNAIAVAAALFTGLPRNPKQFLREE